ncbi:MAG: ATP-grasp domain-containing protein [Candidatus Babeliales bacterium]
MQKIRVGVIMGGMSIEDEVSFNSGRTICDHLDSSCYEIIPLFHTHDNALYILPWRFLHRGKISDFIERLASEGKQVTWDQLKNTIDFMYIATHGRFAEDGTLQGMLEVLGIPYLGAKVYASALRMDKIVQKSVLQRHGVLVPRYAVVRAHEIGQFSLMKDDIYKRMEKAGVVFPCIVKPQAEGSSLGIRKVHTQDDLEEACKKAAWVNAQSAQNVLIEECLFGMEFTCVILTDYTTGQPIFLPPTEIVIEDGSDIFDYEQKYMPGRAQKFTPARCSQELTERIQQTCYTAMRALNITNMSRIDGFVTPHEEIYIIDPNSLSGMGPASFLFKQAAEYGMNHTDLINHLIKTELKSYRIGMEMNTPETKAGAVSATHKLKVAVLLGGRSNEKEISLDSGRNVVYKLSPNTYDVTPLFVSSKLELYRLNAKLLVCNNTGEIERQLTPDLFVAWNDLPKIADFVFIGLHGGEGENGAIQGTLELLKLPYNGPSVLTSALCMNKYETNQLLKAHGFAVPESVLIEKNEWQRAQDQCIQKVITTLQFPLILKPHNDGCSVGVQKILNEQQLKPMLEAFFVDRMQALLEVCVIGMELTVGVIGNTTAQALPPSKAVAAAGVLSMTEKFLPGAGENQTPAPLSAQATELVQRTIEHVYTTVGCKGYSRIDCFYQTQAESPTGFERVVILEINTLPALTPATCLFHQAAELGMKPMDLIDKIVQLGLEQHNGETAKEMNVNKVRHASQTVHLDVK